MKSSIIYISLFCFILMSMSCTSNNKSYQDKVVHWNWMIPENYDIVENTNGFSCTNLDEFPAQGLITFIKKENYDRVETQIFEFESLKESYGLKDSHLEQTSILINDHEFQVSSFGGKVDQGNHILRHHDILMIGEIEDYHCTIQITALNPNKAKRLQKSLTLSSSMEK